jgi:tetratricopeptide (TPR) repeat protein
MARAQLLSLLGEHPAALAEAEGAVARRPASVDALFVRAEVRRRSGDGAGAWADVEGGLRIHPDDPRLLELRGRWKVEAGSASSGLADLDRALFFGAGGSARSARALALMALGRPEDALDDWSRVLADDPDDADAYLGRARALLRLHLWDQALADLEKAAERADDGTPLLGRVTLTYAACLLGRPDRLPRVLTLARRIAAARLVAGR